MMAFQKRGCPRFYLSNAPAFFSSVAFDEILCEQKNIFRALAKGGDTDWKDVETVEQIQTKLPGTNCRWQIAVCSGNYTHVDRKALSASNTLELAFLKHPQQGDLGLGRHLTDLIEKHRPVVRDFEAPGMPLIGAGEGALLIAEELGRHQRRWSDSATHSCENRPGSTRPLVNRASDQFLPRAAFSRDQNGGIAGSNSHHLVGHAADRLRGADDVLEHGCRENVVVTEIERFSREAFRQSPKFQTGFNQTCSGHSFDPFINVFGLLFVIKQGAFLRSRFGGGTFLAAMFAAEDCFEIRIKFLENVCSRVHPNLHAEFGRRLVRGPMIRVVCIRNRNSRGVAQPLRVVWLNMARVSARYEALRE